MKRLAKFILVFVLLSAAGYVFMASDTLMEKPIQIDDFSGGINAYVSDSKIRQNQATEILNFDLGESPGDAKKRTGYVAVSDTIDGNNDALTGVYGMAKRDGTQHLFQVFQDADNDWSNLYVGNPGSTVEIANYLYRTGQYQYLTWKDYSYICDGYNYPTMANDEYYGSMKLPAPGEVMVEILDTEASRSTLNGTYRWALLTYDNCDTTNFPCNGEVGEARIECLTPHLSYITPAITVHKKQVALHVFSDMIADTSCGSPLPLKFYVCRTKADMTDLTHYDTIQYSTPFPDYVIHEPTDSLWVILESMTTVLPESLSTQIVIDSGTDSTAGYGELDSAFVLDNRLNWDDYTSSKATYPQSAGVPRLLARQDTLFNGWTDDGAGIVHVYTMTYYDTIRDIESDTSLNAAFHVRNDSDQVVLSLPPVPDYLDNCVRRIYRRYNAEEDTTEYHMLYEMKDPSESLWVDTINVGFLDNSDVDLPDIVSQGSQFRFDGIVVWDDRMYGWGDDGGPSRLYYSAKDTAKFGQFDYITIGADDGERVMIVVPDRDRLLAYKGSSRHEIYEDANGTFTKSSPPYVSRGTGCIAPKSMAVWRGSRVYLSSYGIVLESGSQYLDKGNTIDTISQGILPYLKAYTKEDLSKALGFIYDGDKYFLSFAEKDTTFVCFLNLPEYPWVVYSIGIKDATLFEEDSDYDYTLPERMVFCMDGSDQLFHWDTTASDNGTGFIARLKSGWYGAAFKYDIPQIFTQTDHADSNDSIALILYDREGDSVYQRYIQLNKRLKRNSIGIDDPQVGYQYEIIAGADVDSVVIEALAIYRKFKGLPGLE